MKLSIVWGSTTGNTQTAAEFLNNELGLPIERCCHVDDMSAEEMIEQDIVLIGVSTWDIGELQYDWPVRLEEMAQLDWSNTIVGFFGCGDGVIYDATFVDAFGLIWEQIEPKGAKLIGKWPVEGFEYTDSKALCDDGKMFLGLPLDDDNQPEMTEDRVKAWAEKLREEIAALG